MTQCPFWQQANQQLICRALSELCFEQALVPECLAQLESDDFTNAATPKLAAYQVTLNGRHYQFLAWQSIWQTLRIAANSLQLITNNHQIAELSAQSNQLAQPAQGKSSSVDALQFALDVAAELQLDAITCGIWLEELQNTLHADAYRLAKLQPLRARELLAMPEPQLHSLLDGHPKAIANRGRMGWGERELQQWAPEAANPQRLLAVAVLRQSLKIGQQADLEASEYCHHIWLPAQFAQFAERLRDQQLDPAQYLIVPCHPWQWQRFISSQYQYAIASQQLVVVGESHDRYLPQQSIRTLSNIDNPTQPDIKLALTILNTSCYRGIPGHLLEVTPQLSAWLKSLSQQDPLLVELGLRVLAEPVALSLPHRYQQQLASPYRYHEMFGVIFRESAQSQAQAGERVLPLSALMQCDGAGQALLCQLINDSQWPVETWLRQWFRHMVVPLLHLQCQYGVGVIGHGQNIVLYLRQHRVCAIAIKDFHGDLRLVDRDLPCYRDLPSNALQQITRLPTAHLAHDLLTGHFLTALRFISPLLAEQMAFSETRFYQLLGETLAHYQQQHPAAAATIAEMGLWSPTLARLCINRVRFAIGYQDSASRPKPTVGGPLRNPLAEYAAHAEFKVPQPASTSIAAQATAQGVTL